MFGFSLLSMSKNVYEVKYAENPVAGKVKFCRVRGPLTMQVRGGDDPRGGRVESSTDIPEGVFGGDLAPKGIVVMPGGDVPEI